MGAWRSAGWGMMMLVLFRGDTHVLFSSTDFLLVGQCGGEELGLAIVSILGGDILLSCCFGIHRKLQLGRNGMNWRQNTF